MKHTAAILHTCSLSILLCAALAATPCWAQAQQDEQGQASDEALSAIEFVSTEETDEEQVLADDTFTNEGSSEGDTEATTVVATEEDVEQAGDDLEEGTSATDGDAEGGDATADDDEQPTSGTADGQESQEGDAAESGTTDTEQPGKQGWIHEDGATYYYKDGQAITGEQELSVEGGEGTAWYWFDASGKLVRNTDVFIPIDEGGKWVRCGATGAMLTGEQFANDPASGHVGWYHFDEETRAMSMGLTTLTTNGGKTVYYDPVTGVMRFGEIQVSGDNGGWYLFEYGTGAMVRGWRYLNANGGKWVYYDPEDGRMAFGKKYVTEGEQGWCLFNETTGATTFGWAYYGGNWYYCNPTNGRMRTGELYVTDGEQGWCLFDLDDASLKFGFQYLSGADKWVYYDTTTGRMRFGEQYVGNNWYLFEQGTGAMARGWRFLPGNGGKWVYYDPTDGHMHFGETKVVEGDQVYWHFFDLGTGAMIRGWHYISGDDGKWVYYAPENGRMCVGEKFVTEGNVGWYYFDKNTGAMQRGLKYLPWSDKVVYYDLQTGRMLFGPQMIGGVCLFFDPFTGAMQSDGFDILFQSIQAITEPVADEDLIAKLTGTGSTVRVIGDSISGGWGVSAEMCYSDNVIAEEGTAVYLEPAYSTPTWTNALRQYLAAREGVLFNAAVPTKDYAWFDSLGETLPDDGLGHFDLTLIMLGANDRWKTEAEVSAAAASVLDKALATSDKVVVIIMTPGNAELTDVSGLYMVNDVLHKACEARGIAMIDAMNTFYNVGSTAGLSTSNLFADGIHLSLAGQATLWRIVSHGLGLS